MRPLVTPFSMKGDTMEYKDTLNMPNTAFEMRGNLPTKEPVILKKWQDDDHYHKILEKNQDHTPFILHDGPPYANGNLHAGTAMNRISGITSGFFRSGRKRLKLSAEAAS